MNFEIYRVCHFVCSTKNLCYSIRRFSFRKWMKRGITIFFTFRIFESSWNFWRNHTGYYPIISGLLGEKNFVDENFRVRSKWNFQCCSKMFLKIRPVIIVLFWQEMFVFFGVWKRVVNWSVEFHSKKPKSEKLENKIFVVELLKCYL